MRKIKSRPKGAIIYLSKSTESDLFNLKRSLLLLENNFNKKFSYPIIIFHEDFDKKIKDELIWISPQIRFVRINFKLPSFIKSCEVNLDIRDSNSPRIYDIGYRHMCRFFTTEVFKHSELKEYDWVWRLDTDSFLYAEIDYDIFAFMERKNYLYGYVHTNLEDPKLLHNLLETTFDYLKNKGISNKKIVDIDKNRMKIIYTNFEISRRDLWERPGIKEYLEHIDRAGGIYKYRWGDAPIHTLAIRLFLPPNKIHRFRDIIYAHELLLNFPPLGMGTFNRIKRFLRRRFA